MQGFPLLWLQFGFYEPNWMKMMKTEWTWSEFLTKYVIYHSPYAIRHSYTPLFTVFAIIRHAPYAIRHVCVPFRHVRHVHYMPFAIFAINGEYMPYMPFCHDGVWRMAYILSAHGVWRMAYGVLYAIRWHMAKVANICQICQKLCHMPYAILACAEPCMHGNQLLPVGSTY